MGPSSSVMRPHLRAVPAPEGRDDGALLGRLRAGDPDAAATLFDRCIGPVERAVHGILGPDPDAEDLVQDAFLAALRGIHGFHGEEVRLGAWVRGIAVRLTLKKLRWRRTRRWSGWLGSDAVPTLQGVGGTETQVTLKRAFAVLEHLPPAERAAFSLRFLEGMRLEEVAETLGISLATAKRRIRSARDRFGRLAESDTLLRNWLETRAPHG